MTIGNKIANWMFGDPVVRHINDASVKPTPSAPTTGMPSAIVGAGVSTTAGAGVSTTAGATATQDMTGQIQYIQCMKEGGTEEVCKDYLA
jgi:hypothetical protein